MRSPQHFLRAGEQLASPVICMRCRGTISLTKEWWESEHNPKKGWLFCSEVCFEQFKQEHPEIHDYTLKT